MAEFCLDCWNKINGTSDSSEKYIFSRDMDICEECGQWKPVIIRVKRRFRFREWFYKQTHYIVKGIEK